MESPGDGPRSPTVVYHPPPNNRYPITNRSIGKPAFPVSPRQGGSTMYITDVIWWAYTAFLVAVAAFMVFFALKVRQKGG